MKGAFLSIAINFFITLSFAFREDMGPVFRTVFTTILLGFVLTSLIGVLLYGKHRKKSHAIVATVGFAFFVPIGFIGVFSLRKQMKADGIYDAAEQ